MSITPFAADGSVDEEGLRTHLRRLVASDTGIYLGSGGAGEGHVLTVDELRLVYRIGVDEAKGRVPLYANPRESRSAAAMYEVARAAVDAGVDVVQIYQVDAGHGMIPTLREQEAYFNALLEKINHPVAISIHAYAGYAAPVGLMSLLCERFPQIEAVNVMGPPNSYFLALRDALPGSVRMYTGVTNLVQLLALGAAGALLAENNIIPETCNAILRAWESRDLEALGTAMSTVQRFTTAVSPWAPSTARWAKTAMKVLGLPAGNGVLRAPYLLPTEEDQKRMAADIRALHIPELQRVA
jgi:4-hydroxy-tetrahydrodipicolinate synthase